MQTPIAGKTARVLPGGTDEEILDWCLQPGRKPEAEQIEIWNGCMSKRGWREAASGGFVQRRAEAGLAHREDIGVFLDLMDEEEGRLPQRLRPVQSRTPGIRP